MKDFEEKLYGKSRWKPLIATDAVVLGKYNWPTVCSDREH
jgi:hypothetical protein